MTGLYKRDPAGAMDRLVKFWRREARERILITTLPPNPYWDRYLQDRGYTARYRISAPGYALTYFPEDVSSFPAQCLAVEDPGRVIEMIDIQQRLCLDLEDDSLPVGYPSLHFGEGVFGAFAGAAVEFSSNGLYTWSATSAPPVREWDDMEGVLAAPLREPWRSRFESMAKYAAAHAAGGYGLRTFITIDTLNLAVEWRGSTAAYTDVIDAPEKLERIFDHGVALNQEVIALETAHLDPYNHRVFENPAFCALAPAIGKPVLSIDAFTLVAPRLYRELGLPYQQRLIDQFGGAHMHLHGTKLYKLLPAVAQLRGLLSIELGDDGLGPADPSPIENLRRIQDEITGDAPLFVHCDGRQFSRGLQARTLAGGVHYCVRDVGGIAEANALAARAHDYVAPA
ncbi:MAG: hypothetical protein KIT09_07605 [Bryobacteraceae bacterium]|nr:hypothetical protein [Bryobacteraceae bacterium]